MSETDSICINRENSLKSAHHSNFPDFLKQINERVVSVY